MKVEDNLKMEAVSYLDLQDIIEEHVYALKCFAQIIGTLSDDEVPEAVSYGIDKALCLMADNINRRFDKALSKLKKQLKDR